MAKPVTTTTTTTTSKAVRVSVLFVVLTATVAALLGIAAIVGRMIKS